MPADNEPRALAVDLLSEIISYIKQAQPTRSDDKSTQGFVYSQLRVGQMISPRDYARPWSPIGGSPAQTASTQQPPAGTDPAAAATAAAAAAAATANTKRAIDATFKTEQLVNTMLVVTNDGTLETYSGGGRHLGFAYKQILDAMEAPPLPPRTPDEQKRIDDARKVLYNDDGTDSSTYAAYKKNQRDYATAQANYVIKSNRLLADPAQAESAPMLLQEEEVAVEQARDKFRSQGAPEIETALATIESLGVSLEQGAIADARKLFDAWNIPVIGVAGAKEPFSFVLPTDWASFDIDDIGWTRVTLTQSDYNSHFENHQYSVASGDWRGSSESTSGDVGVSVMGFGFNGSYSEANSNSQSESSEKSSDGTLFHNDATNLSIDLEYGLCEIARPWLLTDLFRLKNWYIKGEKAGCISTGKIADQAGKEDPLLPMIPTHFLVIRNVRISAEHWNSDGDTLSTYYHKSSGSSEEHSSSIGGNVEVPVFGPICLDAGASHSESGYSGQYRDEGNKDYSNDYKAHYENNTLSINGAQIIAWLSEVIPASPPMDDPDLAKK